MKPILIICALHFFVFSSQGQNKAKKLFQNGIAKFENEAYYDAALDFEKIVKNYKQFEYYDQCFYNMAYAYQKADSLDLAISWYEKIRNSDMKDDDKVGGRGIFEPYANYKHNSTFNIAIIEYNRKNYEKALEYYRQSLNNYPYYNTSGTDLRINKNRLTIYITDCLEKLERYEDALLVILPEALDSKGSAYYQSIVDRSIEIITDHFNKKEFKKEFSTALETLEKNEKDNTFSITIRNKEIQLFPYWLDDYSVDELKKEIMESGFWIFLNKE